MTSKQLDKHIEQIYYRDHSGVQINIIDIGKILFAGRAAAQAGRDIEAAIGQTVNELRVN